MTRRTFPRKIAFVSRPSRGSGAETVTDCDAANNRFYGGTAAAAIGIGVASLVSFPIGIALLVGGGAVAVASYNPICLSDWTS
jgi:hypothetical protein